MAAVRAGVDALDLQLVSLLALRQRYMEAAARIKQTRDQVYDAARVGEILSQVKAAAREAGLSEAIAEPVWRTLIERCIAHELGRWDGQRA